ncbi:hypothetical protein [Rummeliibacillus sp. POC4]|uniref:hypothetical protein n=1 Tax=Rummeliibacillus sp. POC4 TaxID=2305899 RepID=UPI000E66EC70|nr:hypothetical protein [Rummeliibacillus sp. POC4]RIJ64149.1 hypothetical protein D1606_11585 [Rummeliibacillus sp. POC4]
MNWKDEFVACSKINIGVQIEVEMSILVVSFGKRIHTFKKICNSREEALGLIDVYKSVVMNEMFLIQIAANFLCDYLGIEKKGKSLPQVATELKDILKQMEVSL